MALLPESVTAATTGHPGYHNQVHQKLNQAHIDVQRDFGAVAAEDGGTNATSAIQSAFTAAATSRTPVYLPPNKTFPITGLTMTAPFTVFGAGWNSVLKLNNAANAYAITFAPTVGNWFIGSLLENFKIDCNGNNQTTAGGGVDGMGAVWCSFRHLWITKPWGNGLSLHDDNLGGYGHHNVVSEACLFDAGDQSNGGDGRAILMTASDENVITGCAFQDNGRTGATERNHIYDLAGLNYVIANSFVGGGTGVKLQGGNNVAALNTFDGCKDHHIRVNGNQNKVNDNRFYNIGFTGTSIDGIWVDNVANTHITNNFFDTIGSGAAAGGTARSAINLSSGPSTNADVAGNKILASGVAYGTGRIVPGAGTGHNLRNNRGFVTENDGTATIASGTTSIAVTHGLAVTPGLSDLSVTPTNNPAAVARFWISGPTSTQFTINVNADPGATTATFAWQAQVV